MRFSNWRFLASWLACSAGPAPTSIGKSDTQPVRNANHVFNAIHSSMRQWGSSLNHNGMSLFLARVPRGTSFYHGSPRNTSVTGMEWLAFEPEHAIMFAQAFTGVPRRPRNPPPVRPDQCDGKVEDCKAAAQPESTPAPMEAAHLDIDSTRTLHRARVAYNYSTTVLEELPLTIGLDVIVLEKDDSGWWLCECSEMNALGWAPSAFLEMIDVVNYHSKTTDQISIHESESPDRRPPGPPREGRSPGWLHTYMTKHQLNLLYIDGTSAGKSIMGTLDTQQYLLGQEHKSMDDHVRAEEMCNRTRQFWNKRIDGFVRMEMGFEIILCSFADHLDTVRITRGKSLGDDGRFADRNPEDDLFFYRAMTESRYPGIGGSRVSLNYDDFVSVFTYDLDLFNGSTLPRLVNISQEALEPVQQDIDELVLSKHEDEWFDWRSIADMIITRYAVPLAQMNSSKFSDLDDLHLEAQRLMRPYIDYDNRNAAAELERCAVYSLSENYVHSMAGRAIHTISHRICSTMSSILTSNDYEQALGSVHDLVGYLQWTTWKECRGCAWDEVCYTAVWPSGSQEDHDHPHCVNATTKRGMGYWHMGDHGPPPIH